MAKKNPGFHTISGTSTPNLSNAEVATALAWLGLSDTEIMVYRAALETGSRPAGIIAQKARLKRGQTYNVLAQLVGRGIVQEFIKGNVKHFTCSPPVALLSLVEHRQHDLERQKERLKEIIPMLEQIRNPLASQPKVRFYQGVNGVKEIFEDMLRGSDYDIYAVLDLAFNWSSSRAEHLPWINNFIERRAEKGIWYYGIINRSPESDRQLSRRLSHKRKMKMVEGIRLPVDIHIYGTKVAFTSTYDEINGCIIENDATAESLRNLHQAAWKLLPPYRPVRRSSRAKAATSDPRPRTADDLAEGD